MRFQEAGGYVDIYVDVWIIGTNEWVLADWCREPEYGDTCVCAVV